jgi:hypothetical protein
MLVDGGPDPSTLIALDERLPAWDRRIDIRPTHPHENHVAGLAVLLSRYRVGRSEPGMVDRGLYGLGDLAAGGPWDARNRRSADTHASGFGFSGPIPPRAEHPVDGGTAISNVSIAARGLWEALTRR